MRLFQEVHRARQLLASRDKASIRAVFDAVESSIALPPLPTGSFFATLNVPEDAAGSFGLEGLSLSSAATDDVTRTL